AAAADHLVQAFHAYRKYPWTNPRLFDRTFAVASRLAGQHHELADQLMDALSQPFAVYSRDLARSLARTDIGLQPGLERLCVASLASFEPNVPWTRTALQRRYDCYNRFAHPLKEHARADLDLFFANAQ